MSGHPNDNDENPYDFPPEAQGQQKKHQPSSQEGESIIEDVVDSVKDEIIVTGCLWLVTLPFRLIWRMIEAILN